MHLPFGPESGAAEEHAELPEIVPIEELNPRALDAAAREIAEEGPVSTGASEEEGASTWPTATA